MTKRKQRRDRVRRNKVRRASAYRIRLLPRDEKSDAYWNWIRLGCPT